MYLSGLNDVSDAASTVCLLSLLIDANSATDKKERFESVFPEKFADAVRLVLLSVSYLLSLRTNVHT